MGDVVDQRHGGTSGSEAAHDAIILDFMLPLREEFSVCLDLREASVNTPLLMPTVKDSEVEGLDVGAVDYLRKPFECTIFLARRQALLRRQERGRPAPIVVRHIVVDKVKRIMTMHRAEVTLTLRDYRFLEFLMTNVDCPVSKADILETVSGRLGLGPQHCRGLRRLPPSQTRQARQPVAHHHGARRRVLP